MGAADTTTIEPERLNLAAHFKKCAVFFEIGSAPGVPHYLRTKQRNVTILGGEGNSQTRSAMIRKERPIC